MKCQSEFRRNFLKIEAGENNSKGYEASLENLGEKK